MKKLILLAILLTSSAAGLSACATTDGYGTADSELQRALGPKN